ETTNFCYTVTNDGDVPFDLHTLATSAFGDLFTDLPDILLPTESLQFNDMRTLASDVVNDADWTAAQSPFTVTNDAAAFEDISVSGVLVPELADDGEVNLIIPFPFDYFGTVATDIRVGNNGAALFGVTSGDVGWSNTNGLTATEAGMIAPFWDDIGISATTGDLYTQELGTSPDRRFIIQWDKEVAFVIGGSIDSETITFQLVLFETTNEIQFRYSDVIFGGSTAAGDAGASATIGLVSSDGTTIHTYSHNMAVLNDGDVISVMPTTTALPAATASATAEILVLVPQVQAAPSVINSTVASAGTGSEVLAISNIGFGTLNWSVDESSNVAKAPSTRPLSFYTPATKGFASQFADVNTKTNKSVFATKPAGKGLAGPLAPIAYTFDLRNDSFGTIDHTSPGVFNEIVANSTSYYAGDFVNQDYTTLYAVDDSDNLVAINTADGVVTAIAAITGGAADVSGLTEDPTDGTVYLSTTDGATASLYTIDLTTAVSTLVGEVTNSALLIDIAASATGDLYGFDIGSDSLIAIDKATGAGTVVGAIGFDASFAQGMDFDHSTNTLYIAAYFGGGANSILTVDLTTGAATAVGPVNPDTGGAELDAFAIAADVEGCYLQADIPWLSLSTASGSVEAGETDNVTVNFDASALTDGMYSANVCVFSNDPDETLVKVPVNLQVGS
ncbi:hypothetical protein MNBD_GAMMA01-433, partial [hydrothermal vent metagenome]